MYIVLMNKLIININNYFTLNKLTSSQLKIAFVNQKCIVPCHSSEKDENKRCLNLVTLIVCNAKVKYFRNHISFPRDENENEETQ